MKIPKRNRAKSGPKQYKKGPQPTGVLRLRTQIRSLAIRLERFGRKAQGGEALWAGYMTGALLKSLDTADSVLHLGGYPPLTTPTKPE